MDMKDLLPENSQQSVSVKIVTISHMMTLKVLYHHGIAAAMQLSLYQLIRYLTGTIPDAQWSYSMSDSMIPAES